MLSNLVLDELDKELEKRGHEFSRYADDGLMNVNSWVLVFMEIESRSAKHLLRSLSHVSVKLPAVFEERRFKTVIKVLTTFLRGWQGYYGISECQSIFKTVDSWTKRLLRALMWKQWERADCREL